MMTREDFLAQVAAMINLNVAPLKAFAFVFDSQVIPDLPEHVTKVHITDPIHGGLSEDVCYMADVDDQLGYTIRDEWGEKRMRARGALYGNLTQDFSGTNGPFVAKLMLALLAAAQLNRCRVQWGDDAKQFALMPLPSRTSDRDPVVPPPALPGAGRLFDS